jgi:hypothetical protein
MRPKSMPTRTPSTRTQSRLSSSCDVLPAPLGGPDAHRNCANDERDADELEAWRVVGLPVHNAGDTERDGQNGNQVLQGVSCQRANPPQILPLRGVGFVDALSRLGTS